MHKLTAIAFVLGTSLLVGCTAAGGGASSAGGDNAGANGNADASAAFAPSRTADVRVLLTDAPAAYDHVYVDLVSIAIHERGAADASADGGAPDDGGAPAGWITLAVPNQRVDLLTLQNGVTLALGGATVAAGSYDQLRLIVSGGAVTVGGVDAPLTIPSGAESGVKIDVDETFASDMASTLTLDFDAAASVVDAHGKYLLKPVLKIAARSDEPRAARDAGN